MASRTMTIRVRASVSPWFYWAIAAGKFLAPVVCLSPWLAERMVDVVRAIGYSSIRVKVLNGK